MQTLQSLQNQQNMIVAAVSPLLPLLQRISSTQTPHVCAIPDPHKRVELSKSSSPAPSMLSTSSEPSDKATRKRSRSSSADAPPSSSPTAIPLHQRKKSRPNKPSPVRTTTRTLFFGASPGAQKPSGTKGRAPETPRRPLQEIFYQSPKPFMTPKSVHQNQRAAALSGGTPLNRLANASFVSSKQ